MARETGRILLLDLQLQNDLIQKEPDLGTEVNFFLATLNDVGLSAGGYIYFSKGFLLSFYGILVTYIAVLVQSI